MPKYKVTLLVKKDLYVEAPDMDALGNFIYMAADNLDRDDADWKITEVKKLPKNNSVRVNSHGFEDF